MTVLIANSQTYRDCWVEENGYLVLRQMSFNVDGTDGVFTKIFRISPEEFEKMQKLKENKENGTEKE